MYHIPVVFLSVIVVLALAAYLVSDRRFASFRTGIVAFLVVYALFLTSNGVSYGYEVQAISLMRVLLGFLLGPLAYLAFRGPTLITREAAIHYTVAVLAFALSTAMPILIDPLLAIFGIGYALAICVSRARHAALAVWVPQQFVSQMRGAALLTAIVLMTGALGDIALQLSMTGSTPVAQDIVISLLASATVFFAVLATLLFFLRFSTALQTEDYQTKRQDFAKILAYLNETNAVSDANYSLKRFAKDLKMSPRHVSEVVNQVTGDNVSRLINKRRIEMACEMLETTDKNVTNVMLDSGFFTKSNFNKEFKRETGLAPTKWRKSQGRLANSG